MLIALFLAAAAALVAWIIERRKPDPPARDASPVPAQLDRSDFERPEAPWLVVLFSSASCESCPAVAAKLPALESEDVAVQDVEWSTRRDLHERYRIDAVPLALVADDQGVVRAAFLGKVSAADLWSAVADVRSG